jgi:hypothetical protein
MPAFNNIQDSQTGEWQCTCGNHAALDGFETCNAKGEEQEPAPGWLGLYRCNNCMNIVDSAGNVRGNLKNGAESIVLDGLEPLKPQHPQTAVDLLPAFDAQLGDAADLFERLQDTLQKSYKLTWETKQNVAGILLLQMLEETRQLQTRFTTLRNEIERDRD